ncbi:PREDICTED: aldehyde oxidase GLOX-like isoform X1 [Camelina sativa]|uniref:Aldehyde oxidase GLOX-like isoform X1 n=1 Tax=Camelina sativa TaxID=90675 RepID=A0ABM0SUT6_CAMSA|nr:PREDICTED: aldehyde oxidase GLOX-like isoform X1 [Camelina sativa]
MAAKATIRNFTDVNYLRYLALFFLLSCHLTSGAGGTWKLLLPNVGISAMHSQLLHNDRVIMYDRTNFGPSNISLPHGACRQSPNDAISKTDCTAHSVEYNVALNSIRPLTVQSNTWCSSGGVTPDGTLLQTGGSRDGELKTRLFAPCDDDSCDWTEVDNGLAAARWYASNHVLPDGRQIIIGGRDQFNYEFFPKTNAPNLYALPFLTQTTDPGQENNLYPYVFLNTDGNLFIFANNRAILLNYATNTVVKTYPEIPGGDPRSYPSTGSAVLLPIKNLVLEVLVCGGAPKGSYIFAFKSKTFIKALDTCARININDPNPQWAVEKMPRARVMGDMTLLPDGHVLLINGGSSGTAAWELGREPVFNPDIYYPDRPVGSRFEPQNANAIPRMYHSTATLLRDGRVIVGGSNPHAYYNFTGVLFPTELSLEAFSPSYLESKYSSLRPVIMDPMPQTTINYGQILRLRFTVQGRMKTPVKVTMVYPSFNTHSFSMSQRLLVLDHVLFLRIGLSRIYEVSVRTPSSVNLAPPGYYMVFVVNQNIPSEGVWVRLQ